MKKGFTLVEMLVVIGIIGILMGTLIAATGRSSDAAQAAKCLANMKNLANAAQSYAVDNGSYPTAGSVVRRHRSGSSAQGNREVTYTEGKGWVSGNSQGKFPSSGAQAIEPIGAYTQDNEMAHYSITNGALWRYIGGSLDSYVCPIHKKKHPKAHRSYFMNARFGWSADPTHTYGDSYGFVKYGKLAGADRVLLFAEMPFAGPGGWKPTDDGSTDETDGILQYDGCSHPPACVAGQNIADGEENIGANHRVGKSWYAHVVFADGHVEKIRADLNDSALKKLTTLLCEGKAIGFNGSEYEELN